VAEQVRPGHFVALAVGGETSAHLLRRAFSVYRTQDRGVYGGTIDLVIAEHGPGTRWLAHVRQHDSIDVVGPLGKPFALPKEPVPCTLVGGGYGSAPLFTLSPGNTYEFALFAERNGLGVAGFPLRRKTTEEPIAGARRQTPRSWNTF
jgi:hypothetical protein